MRRLLLLACLCAGTAAASETRIEVCHLPPGNPGNYHTLVIPAPAVKAHLAHGDLLGACGNYCGLFCSTGNKCAQDTGTFDPATGRCACSSVPVDCSPTSPCLTAAGCDPVQGCLYAVNAGATCNADNNVCTGPDFCDATGVCQPGPAVPGCCLTNVDCPNDACVQYQCNATTNLCQLASVTSCAPPDACTVGLCDATSGCAYTPVVCTPPDQCHVASCDPVAGCSSTPVACSAGTCPTPCGTQCVDTGSDPSNCGACGQACSTNHVAAACSGGICSGTCAPGWADCNANQLVDGCETDLMNDPANCGACGAVCGAGTTCVAGKCASPCPGGHCSTTAGQACGYDRDCPVGETCLPPSPRFVDNRDGTVTDKQTCLQWEQKTGDPSAGKVFCTDAIACPDSHAVINLYNWSTGLDPTWSFDGTGATVFLAQLNASAFAGHSDWRLPTMGTNASVPANPELESIALQGCTSPTLVPCIDPIFGPTAVAVYESASTYAYDPSASLGVSFGDGQAAIGPKVYWSCMRAVRGP